MPVFNSGDWLRLALLSIIHQSFTDWELLLIDDGSTDGAVENNHDLFDSRIRIIRDGLNLGLAARLNQAIDLARGRYFARMDQDDISHPERFSRQIEFLQDHAEIDLLGTRCVTLSEENEVLGTLPGAGGHEDICGRPWRGFYLPHPSWMGRIQWFRNHRYASPAPYLCEDQELLLRSFVSSRFHVLPDFLLAYRLRERIVWRKQWRTRWTFFKVQQRFFSRSGLIGFAILSFLVTVIRVWRDGVCWLGQQFPGRRGGRESRGHTALPDAAFWVRWIENLQKY